MTVDDWRSPKTWWVAIGLASLAALVYLCLAIWFVPRWAANGVKSSDPAAQAAARANERGSVRTAMLAVLAGGIAAAGAVYTGRTFELNRRGQITERFHRAVELLGHQHANARVGGIYSLEQIAHDSPEDHHGPIIELLAAYIRASAPVGDDAEPRTPSVGKARPAPDVQSALTVLARRNSEHDDPQTQIRLADAYLRGATLRGGSFDRARFRRADLRNARLEGTRLRDAEFREAHLQGAHFHADAELALEAADLRGAKFPKAHLEGAHLEDAHLEGADLSDADLEGADLTLAHVAGADLTGANLKRAVLREADLAGARLRQTNLNGAQLMRADLEGRADLEAADLYEADLDGALFVEARLRGANFRKANLRGSVLFNARLEGADLTGANLEGADLREATLRGAIYDRDSTIWPKGFDPAAAEAVPRE